MNGSHQPDSLEDTINFGKNTHTQNKANLKTRVIKNIQILDWSQHTGLVF